MDLGFIKWILLIIMIILLLIGATRIPSHYKNIRISREINKRIEQQNVLALRMEKKKMVLMKKFSENQYYILKILNR
ncbi:hypothetical protein [Alkalicoccobacillus gibsonii]|uniref:hypothetical protein n=1 Tax=Alkalicoccobacillus gibsonii TaxID=79881 RepID=UPI0035132506